MLGFFKIVFAVRTDMLKSRWDYCSFLLPLHTQNVSAPVEVFPFSLKKITTVALLIEKSALSRNKRKLLLLVKV